MYLSVLVFYSLVISFLNFNRMKIINKYWHTEVKKGYCFDGTFEGFAIKTKGL